MKSKELIYGDLFVQPRILADIHSQFKRHAMKVHPDRGGSAEEFQELKRLYQDAIVAFNNRRFWLSSSSIQLLDGKEIPYRWKGKTELSQIYSGENHIVFVDPTAQSDLTTNAKQIIDLCHFKLKDVSNPSIKKTEETIPKFAIKDESILVTTKTPNFHPLSLVVERYSFTSEDIAWVIGRLIHFMNFFEWTQIMHGSISIENLWVDLDHHRIGIFGGWEYSRKYGDRLLALPSKSAKFLSDEPIAGPNIDRDCIRETILELFGVKSAGALRMNKSVPASVIDFLSVPFRKSAIAVYQEWENKRDKGFGPRKFRHFKYNIDQLYQQ